MVFICSWLSFNHLCFANFKFGVFVISASGCAMYRSGPCPNFHEADSCCFETDLNDL